MAAAPCTISSKTINWLTACLAVRITKEGIEPFVNDEIEQFQQTCLADICNNNGIPPGTVCSSCCTENVVVCPTNRICNVRRGTCNYHKGVAKQYLPAGCPKQICHNLRNDIKDAHRYYGPSYKNTDATQWCTNPWEIAKCFMPPDGYKNVTSPAETDFNGIINVILNYKDFQTRISDDLSKQSNIFEKGRNVGKAVRHSPCMEIEDTDLQQYFTDLQNLLSDQKLHAGNNVVQNAMKNISQLQNNTLVIDLKNVQQMLEDVAKYVLHDIKEAKDDLKKASDKRKLELITEMKNSVEATGQSSLSEINDALNSALRKIETKAEYSIDRIQSETTESLEKLKTDADASIANITERTEESIQRIEKTFTTHSDQIIEDKYNKLKKVSHPVMNKMNQRPENASATYQNVQSKVLPQRGAFPSDQTRGVTPIQERSKLPSQEVELDDLNSKFGQSVNLNGGIDQIDANGDMEHSTNLTRNSENAQLNSKAFIASGVNVAESTPVQVSEKEDLKDELTGTTKQDSWVYIKTARGLQPESNDIKISRDIENRLEKKFAPPQDKPRRKCTHDGRLLMLDGQDFSDIKEYYCNTNKPKIGGFGKVYISEDQIPGLKIKVALKKIKYDGSTHLENSAVNEKLASRIMHFAIVPLLAMGRDTAKRKIWFLYPRLDRGDLYTLIETDTERIENHKMKEVELKKNIRLRIMYHVSAAIDFLHTEIKNLRGAILHLDIKTKNIVLDQKYNARLVDFGVAREAPGNETSINTLPASIPYTHGYYTPLTDKLEKSFDYYNFGVVIRELLTGKPPFFKQGYSIKYLKEMDDLKLKVYIQLQGNIWSGDKEISKVALTLLELSCKCIKSAPGRELNDAKEKLTSTHILKEMEVVMRGRETWVRVPPEEQKPEEDNCEMCMINPAVADDLISHPSNCRCPLKVCLSCMRNSYLNPLRCHSCFQEIEPVIGSKYGAVLVAGQYGDDFSDSCAKDVAKMQKVFTSKCPLVIGIRDECVSTITQRNKGTKQKDSVKSQIKSELLALKESGIKTFLFYYSGHYSAQDEWFMLRKGHGEAENMHLMEFIDMLKIVSTENKGKSDEQFIIILDCCNAPIIANHGLREDMCLNIVQLNACRPNEAAVQEPTGSVFTKLFIQALTMKSTKSKCILKSDLGNDCTICPIKDDDYITIGSLNTYICSHMGAFQKGRGKDGPVPVQYAVTDKRIAYVVESSSELNFTLRFDDRTSSCSINCEFFTNICQLKNELFHQFMEKMRGEKRRGDKEKRNNSQVELKAEIYKDILQIVIQMGPKDKHRCELCTLEKVMSAWYGKRDLFVELRHVDRIKEGMVGVFMDGIGKLVLSSISEHKKHEQDEDEERIIYNFDDDDVEFLKEFNIKVLPYLQLGLLEIPADERQGAELHIICPCYIDEKGVRHVREDFVCFNIHYKK